MPPRRYGNEELRDRRGGPTWSLKNAMIFDVWRPKPLINGGRGNLRGWLRCTSVLGLDSLAACSRRCARGNGISDAYADMLGRCDARWPIISSRLSDSLHMIPFDPRSPDPRTRRWINVYSVIAWIFVENHLVQRWFSVTIKLNRAIYKEILNKKKHLIISLILNFSLFLFSYDLKDAKKRIRRKKMCGLRYRSQKDNVCNT